MSKTAEFLQLTCANIDVLYQTKQEMSVVTHESLSRLVLDWMKRQLTEETMNLNQLLERTHLLYLALDNSLQDCSDLPPGHESESDLVQDYKRLVLKCPNNKGRRKQLGAPVRPRVLIYSRDIGQREDRNDGTEPDWNLIGSAKVSENTFLALVTLNGLLTRVSVQLRLNLPPTTPSPVHAPEKVAGIVGMSLQLSRSNTSSSGSINAKCEEDPLNQQPELFCEVATMSGPKCGLGVAEWDGKLLVCGGYDRGECLRSVESYDPELNAWTNQSNMGEARGRVQISVVNNIVYAVGGSNGRCIRTERRFTIELVIHFMRASIFLQVQLNWILSNAWNRTAKNGTNAANCHWPEAMLACARCTAAFIASAAGMAKSVLNSATSIVRLKTNGHRYRR